MKFGVTTFPTDYSLPPAQLAIALEERGFESLWVAEHSHIPASRRSPWPGGAELPKMYYDVLEPFVALASAASVTSTLRLATGICLVVQRDPIQTAKSVASLDQISGGRFLFGIGAGWNAEEMANHGTLDFAHRFSLMRERVEAMKAIWSESKAEYHGRYVDFDPIMTWPKPTRKPHPPIHVGGGRGAMRRAIRYGDGWLPIDGRDLDVAAEMEPFRELAREHGRSSEELEVSVYGSPGRAEDVSRFRDAGVSRVVFGVAPQDRDATLARLDQLAALI